METMTLVIRAWVDPDEAANPRARLLTVDCAEEPRTWSVAVGPAAIAQDVLTWLRYLGGAVPPAAGRSVGSGPSAEV
jgi:hypothetical protein